MEARFEQIIRASDGASHLTALDTFFDEVVQASKSGNTSTPAVNIFKRIVNEDMSQQLAKTASAQLASKLAKGLSAEMFEEFCNQVLSSLRTTSGTFDEADYTLRDHLFNVYVGWGQFSDAAQALGALHLESAVRKYTDQEKANIFIKCAEAYLEDEAFVDAEVFVNKASPFINNVTDIAILLRYRATFAKVLDSNRKFIEAAVRYYELSTTTNANIDPDDLLELLAKAVTCVILGKTGPPRSRVMGLLVKDERINNLEYIPKYSSHAIILHKMHKEQIIRKQELSVFEEVLLDHQKAMTSDGFTFFEKAIIEHNMLATSNLYSNIHIAELANILLIDERRAEKVVAAMISEGRLKGSIDQVERLLIFESGADNIAKFNSEITAICQEVQKFVDALQ